MLFSSISALKKKTQDFIATACFFISWWYLCLTQPQLYPLQRLVDDAGLLLLNAAALWHRPALQRLLQALQQAAVLPSQRLQPCDHLLRATQNLLPRQHGCCSEVPFLTATDLRTAHRYSIICSGSLLCIYLAVTAE